MNRTLLDECFRVGSRTPGTSRSSNCRQLQTDLDRFLERYNLRRSHQGYRLGGRTPAQAFADATAVTADQLLALLTAPKEDPIPTAA